MITEKRLRDLEAANVKLKAQITQLQALVLAQQTHTDTVGDQLVELGAAVSNPVDSAAITTASRAAKTAGKVFVGGTQTTVGFA